jgi:hypothetical protein
MASRANRRLLCVVIALLFTISGVARLYAATASSLQLPMSAMEDTMPGHDDCGGKDKAAHAACLAMCATAVAILSEPTVIVLASAIQDRHPASEALPAGRRLSPEPPPPKS